MNYYITYDTDSSSEIYHFGTKGKSGRYPWGSGGRPFQRLEKSLGRKVKKSMQQHRDKITRDRQQKAAAKQAIKDYKRLRKQRHRLTHEDINELISKLESEKRLRMLIDEEVMPKRKFVKDILTESGKKVLTNYLTNAGYWALANIANQREIAKGDDGKVYKDMPSLAAYLMRSNQSQSSNNQDKKKKGLSHSNLGYNKQFKRSIQLTKADLDNIKKRIAKVLMEYKVGANNKLTVQDDLYLATKVVAALTMYGFDDSTASSIIKLGVDMYNRRSEGATYNISNGLNETLYDKLCVAIDSRL